MKNATEPTVGTVLPRVQEVSSNGTTDPLVITEPSRGSRVLVLEAPEAPPTEMTKTIEEIAASVLPKAPEIATTATPESAEIAEPFWRNSRVMAPAFALCLACLISIGVWRTQRERNVTPPTRAVLPPTLAVPFSSPSIIRRFEAPIWGQLPAAGFDVRLYIKPEDGDQVYYLDRTETEKLDPYWVKPVVRFGDPDEARLNKSLPLDFKVFAVIAKTGAIGLPGDGRSPGTH